MAASVNKVIIIGHLGADPEMRRFQNGGKVVNFRVATSESWKDKQTGERKEQTEWHSVAVQAEHAANYAEQYLRKGSKVYVEGKLKTRKWQDQSGTDRYTTEIVVSAYSGEVQGLDGRQDSDGGSGRGDRGQSRNDRGGDSGLRASGGSAGGGGPKHGPDLDDEIPF